MGIVVFLFYREITFIYFENVGQDVNVSYDRLLTCDVDSPGPDEVHLVPHEDEGAVREAGAGGEAHSLQSVRGRQ